MNKPRPVNLDLTSISFPIPAIISILHRISGVVMFLALPLLLWALKLSLANPTSFINIKLLLTHGFVSFCFWGVLLATAYHMLAGIRHLIMDLGYFEGLQCSRCSAWVVLFISIVVAGLLGVWLWM